jgi:muconate cycloisomerase
VAYGNDFAKAAIEMAMFDAVGKKLDVPVHTLLGGGAARESIPVRWALSGLGIDDAILEATARRALGHRSMKLKMGALPPRDDLARVAAIIDGVGTDIDYLVDPNGSWDLRTATWMMVELERLGVATVEQPVRRDDLCAMAELVRRSNHISVMADEAVCRPADALRAVKARACDSVAIKVGKAGGLLRGSAVAAITTAAGMGCYGGSSLESSIGTAAAAHLFASLPALTEGCELVGPQLLVDDIVVTPIEYHDGSVMIPKGPGLGVELDWDKVRAYSRPAAH